MTGLRPRDNVGMTEDREKQARAPVEELLAARLQRQKEAFETLRGIGWEGDLEASREGRKTPILENP